MKIFLIILILSLEMFAINTNSEEKKLNTNIAIEDEFQNEFYEKNNSVIYDPFSSYNKFMTKFNDSIYMHIALPIVDGYDAIVPLPVQDSIGNFFDNLMFPLRFINNLLQFKFKNTLEETGRFAVNSTFGLLGFFDFAKDTLHWQAHKEDFGQTLGFYGVGPGPHIVLPLLGPSNVRDAFSIIPNNLVNPISGYVYESANNKSSLLILTSIDYINDIASIMDEYISIRDDAIDLYPLLRDFYEQKRINQIKE